MYSDICGLDAGTNRFFLFSPLNIKSEATTSPRCRRRWLNCIARVRYRRTVDKDHSGIFSPEDESLRRIRGNQFLPAAKLLSLSFPIRFTELSLSRNKRVLVFSRYYISTYKLHSTTPPLILFILRSFLLPFFPVIQKKGAVWGVRRGLGQDN